MSVQPKRKFNLRFKTNTMDEKAAHGVWLSLKSAIEQIFAANASSLSFEELYRFAYNLVLHKHGQMLYDGVKATITEKLRAVANSVAEAVDSNLLHVLQTHWERQKVILRMIDDILMYMDRTFVQQKQLPSMYDAGLIIFRDMVIRHSHVRARLQQLLLANVHAERRGEMIDVDLMRATLAMLVHLGSDKLTVYESEFETAFLRATRQFYQEEALEFLTRSTCPDYLSKADRRIKEEKLRVRQYLHRTTSKKLRAVVEKLLIENNAEALVAMDGSGAITMFQQDRFTDLERMYRLFALVPSTLSTLRVCMRDLVSAEGKALVTDQERSKVPVEFVQKLLDMRDKYTRIIDTSFNGDKTFHRYLREAFEHFMNLDARCAQFLSMYVDDMMRHGFKGLSEEAVDTVLDKVVVIFRYLRDKDVFENFYKHHLQKRLLGHRSLSDEAERNMITKLKSECGFQFTSKLEGMFNDLGISRDFMEAFRREGAARSAVVLEATVLTTGFWPAQNIPPCLLPGSALAACEQFREFYMSKHTGRRLTWQTNQGTADIRTLYTEKRHELTVSTYQMCILMHFNSKEEFSFKELMDGTHIPIDELKRHLLSLTTPRSRIILKLKKGKEIADEDRFRLNREFNSKMLRIKVPLVSMRSAVTSKPMAAAVPETVEEDRRHAIEAAVVRIMKTRKVLDHSNLVAEVARQLSTRFRPSPADIKKRIESLIERDYLERSEEDRRVYHYLA